MKMKLIMENFNRSMNRLMQEEVVNPDDKIVSKLSDEAKTKYKQLVGRYLKSDGSVNTVRLEMDLADSYSTGDPSSRVRIPLRLKGVDKLAKELMDAGVDINFKGIDVSKLEQEDVQEIYDTVDRILDAISDLRGPKDSADALRGDIQDPYENEEGLKYQLYKIQAKMDLLWSNGEGREKDGTDTPEMRDLVKKRNIIAKKLDLPDLASIRDLVDELEKEYQKRFGEQGPFGEWAEMDADAGFGTGFEGELTQ